MKRVLSIAIASLFAGAAHSADLMQAYRDALNNDAQYAAARSAAEAGQERKAQGLAGLLPQIGASAGSEYNDTSRDLPKPEISGRYNSNHWGVQMTQPVFRLQNWIQYQQGSLSAGIAELQAKSAQQDLILRVATAYFDLLNAQETLASIEAQKAANAQQLELAKKSFEVGTTTITDVHEAQSRFDLAVAREAATRADVAIKKQALQQITGKDQGPLAPLREGVRFDQPQPNDINQWVTSATEGNLGTQQAQLAAEIADREVSRSRSGHLPTADVVAKYGYNHTGALGDIIATEAKTNSGSIGVQINVPIFEGGYTQSKVRESIALRDKARSDLEYARRSASLGAQQAFLGVSSGIAQVAGYEAALVSSRSAVESNKLGYQVGVRINIDVLNAELQYYETFRQLARARYDTAIAQLRLKNAAGTLSEEDVQTINGLLDPAAAGRPIVVPSTNPPPLEKSTPGKAEPKKVEPKKVELAPASKNGKK
ncbi:TolC family outer membrane protein [Niveibacterium sp. 24ML]|uniref:TolC family outer membrane protein n=1 Tax=Niveibacterium sp. 24ML TaxID=2985512 RepID=UPI002271EA84|nr:TolC family outer membrane protein [Niveibacterium sp. 24ML]MCX9154544.1 TolC family outer membrane protein [Niveibacterium sp. 24ML]